MPSLEKKFETLTPKIVFRWLTQILSIASGIGAIVFIFYFMSFPGDLSPKQEVWGAFGDFIGGILNPVFSFLALIALLLTIVLQSKELELSRNELAKSASALKEQSESQKLQNFESTFFQMIRLHNDIIKEMLYDNSSFENEEIYRGRACFSMLHSNLSHKYRMHYQNQEETNNGNQLLDDELLNMIVSIYNEFYDKYQEHIGHYFRNLNTILEFVDRSDSHNKEWYINIVRSQISSYEFILIFYNCLGDVNSNDLKHLIEKYEFLKNMDQSQLNENEIKLMSLYNKAAFGEYA